jgi:hypothetical protein
MKRLLILSTLTALVAASSGCFHCFQRTQTARPCAPVASPCAPVAAPCCPPADPCATPGYSAVPSLSVPAGAATVTVMPGPEAYTTP